MKGAQKSKASIEGEEFILKCLLQRPHTIVEITNLRPELAMSIHNLLTRLKKDRLIYRMGTAIGDNIKGRTTLYALGEQPADFVPVQPSSRRILLGKPFVSDKYEDPILKPKQIKQKFVPIAVSVQTWISQLSLCRMDISEERRFSDIQSRRLNK